MRYTTLRLLIASLTGIACYTYLYYSEHSELPNYWGTRKEVFWALVTTHAIAFAIQYWEKFLTQFFSRKKLPILRLVTSIFSGLLIGGVILTSIATYYFDISPSAQGLQHFFIAQDELVIRTAVIFFFAMLCYVVVDFSRYAYNEFAVVQIESVEFKRQQLQLQFDALKSQLSPHYLFNCLNTISSLVYKDAHLAEAFVRRMTQTYQYVLDTHTTSLVNLQQEVDFVKAYHFLLNIRFGERVKVSVNLPEHLSETQIPPLTLQMLVENAVKHNVIGDEEPLHIQIQADKQGYIHVQNNMTSKPTHSSSLEIGLENIKKRYSYFTQKPLKITHQDRFTVSLPVISKNAITETLQSA